MNSDAHEDGGGDRFWFEGVALPIRLQSSGVRTTLTWGSAFSLEPILTQSAWFRAHNNDDVIKHRYVVGAGTHPVARVPGVIASAEATASLMLNRIPGP